MAQHGAANAHNAPSERREQAARTYTVLEEQGASPTAHGLYRRLFVITITYGALTVLAGMPTWIGLIQQSRQLFRLTPYVVAAMVPVTLLVDLVALWLFSQPIRDGLEHIREGTGTPDILERALLQALNFPALTFLRVMFIHLPAGFVAGFIAFAVMSPRLGILLSGRTLIFLVVMGTVISLTHAILEYFAVQRAIQPVVAYIARYCPTRPEVLRERTKTVGIQTQLLFVMTAITVIPLVIIGVNIVFRLIIPLEPGSDLPEVSGRSLLLPLVGVMIYALIFMTVIAVMLSRHFRSLIDRMVQAMSRVRDGDLNQRLDVISADEFAALYTGFNEMIGGLRERARLHDAFGRYVSPELAERIQNEGVILSGQTVDVTVMFGDIRDFTAMSERMPAHEVVSLLNSYFAVIEPIVEREDGWINRFMGDGFMAVFGAPVPCPDHATHAVRAALAIHEAVLDFNERSNWPPIRIGIGIDTGEMVAGSVGSPDRVEYTVIGHGANTASRIEALNKDFGTTLLISQAVYERAEIDREARQMPPVRVRGVVEPITVYALV
ncbi:MAG: adenylate/guanylate cyclase domain-containing protein [Aggregatilineales bacterium]